MSHDSQMNTEKLYHECPLPSHCSNFPEISITLFLLRRQTAALSYPELLLTVLNCILF